MGDILLGKTVRLVTDEGESVRSRFPLFEWKNWNDVAQAISQTELIGEINGAKSLPADNQQMLQLDLV